MFFYLFIYSYDAKHFFADFVMTKCSTNKMLFDLYECLCKVHYVPVAPINMRRFMLMPRAPSAPAVLCEMRRMRFKVI